MGPQYDLSVIIVSWNVRALLERCLSSLRRQTGVHVETFVVDNASNDGSAEMVARDFPETTLLAQTKNLGFAAANNLALHKAQGRHVLFLNPDTELPDGVLAKTVAALDAQPTVGVLGCALRNPDGTPQPSVRSFPTLSALLLILLKLHVLFPGAGPLRTYLRKDFSYHDAADVDQVMGAFFAMRGSEARAIGGFDKRYFTWFEEVDVCKQVYRRGMRVRFDPSFWITHHGGASFGQWHTVRQQVTFVRSALLYARRNMRFYETVLLAIAGAVSLPLAVLEHLFVRRKR